VNSQTQVLILVVVVVLIVAVLVVWTVLRRRRSQNLKEKFGPEYDVALEKAGDRHTAEGTLDERAKRITKLNIRDLNPNERDRYLAEWNGIQTLFVDNPSNAVKEANRLITEVMIARGFPVADFDQRAEDLSVLYPDFIANYRNANAIALKNKSNGASTEELRQAMVNYGSLFKELLGTVEGKDVAYTEKKDGAPNVK
jgi:hypothetical protein